MAETYDIIIAGAGHNGLTAGGYMAKAGMSVCVVEGNSYIGGGVLTRELATPGFKLDVCSIIHVMIQANPLIKNDELGLLSKYGLKYLYPDLQGVMHFYDGTYMKVHQSLDNTCNAIAKFSEKDAESYRKFYQWSVKTLEMMLQGVYSPPPPFGSFLSIMGESEEGQTLVRALMMSSLDILTDWFESEKVRTGITRWISELMMHPDTKGTGLTLFLMIPLLHQYGGGMPVGGSGALTQAMGRCLEANGATIKTSSPIKKFKVTNGECDGVILESGEEILARKGVFSNLNIKQMFPKMVDAGDLPPDFANKVNQIQFSDFVHFQQGYALNESPKYIAGSELDETFFVEFAPNTLEEYLRYFDDLKYGVLRHNPFVACQTLHDPSRAPEGKHTLYLYDFVPYNLKDGGAAKWDEIREKYADETLEFLRKYTTNMGPENIIGRFVHTPVDSEKYNPAFVEGDFGHIGAHLWQTMGNRPLPKWNYRTPIKKLYMSSASCHPGLGVTAGAGRAAAQVAMEDMGIDFEATVK